MTQPPPDPYQPAQYQPAQYPSYPGQPGYPGQMRSVDQFTTSYRRPTAVTLGFFAWLPAALSWPLGTLVRELVAGSTLTGFGLVMTLFILGCVGIGGVWGAIMFLRGSYQARLALCGVSLLVEIMAVINLVAVLRGGTGTSGMAEVIAWAVIIARLVLPPIAVVLSLLPGTREYFAANLG
jgi:hypothetical protein